MVKNYMEDVAKMLGVELGEEFKVAERGCSYDTLYHFDKHGAWDEDCQVADAIIPVLLTGSYEIVKLPWKPRKGAEYWYPNIFRKNVASTCWVGGTADYAIHTLNMCYRTHEEAEAHFTEDYKKLTGEELKP